jgi:hypothetical protein
MKKEQIENMIDKFINNSILEGKPTSSLMDELYTKACNIGKTLDKQNIKISQFDGIEFEQIEPIRVRYVVHYVRHCKKRMKDMVWIIRKSESMKKTKHEMFKLLKFKEKMTCTTI